MALRKPHSTPPNPPKDLKPNKIGGWLSCR
jgi:hypothetical protein